MQNIIIRITQENNNLLKEKNIGCFILPDTLSPDFAARFVAEAKQNGQLTLAEGNNALAFHKEFNTDGLILNTVKESNPRKFIENIRAQAKNAVIGAISRNRRHEAMLVSEAEPDFIIFQIWKDGLEKNLELIDWYNEFFLIQNAAWLQDDVELSNLKSDFLILDDVKFFSLDI